MKQFKEGDWVRIKDKNFNAIFQIDLIDEYGNLYDKNQNYKGEQKYWEHWKPKEGEWCWVSKNLSKIVTHDRDGYITCLNSNGTYTEYMKLEYIYKIAEPFIGELPSFLKVVI